MMTETAAGAIASIDALERLKKFTEEITPFIDQADLSVGGKQGDEDKEGPDYYLKLAKGNIAHAAYQIGLAVQRAAEKSPAIAIAS